MNSIYSVLIVTCVIASIGMIFHIHSVTAIPKSSKFWFSALYGFMSIGAIAEWIGVWLNLHPISPNIHQCFKLLEFCITPMLPILMAYGCGLKKSAKPFWIIVIIHVGVEIALLPFAKIINITPEGYKRGEWYFIYILVYSITFVYQLTMLYHLSKRFQNRDALTLITALLLVFCSVVPSIIHSATRTAFFGMTITGIVLYLYYEGLTLQDMMRGISEKNEKIRAMQDKIIVGIADLVESRDSNTGTHIKNTAHYVELIVKKAMEMGIYNIDEKFADMMISAAPLHDVGKLVVPDTILRKTARLTDEEFEIIKKHTSEGGKIVKHLLEDITDNEYIQLVYNVAKYHHEKWDGSGYPEGLKGEEIPIEARIMAIADVYDALTMERVYKKALPRKMALSYIAENLGKQFDPAITPLFLSLMKNS